MAMSGIVDGFALYTTNGRYLTPSKSPISITIARSLACPSSEPTLSSVPFHWSFWWEETKTKPRGQMDANEVL